jgi:hypothetical protein
VYDRLQLEAKTTIELVIDTIKSSSKEYIYIGRGFNTRVPLPEDISYSAPYLYIAKLIPDKNVSQVKGIKDKVTRDSKRTYDYYLFYVKKEKKDEDEPDYLQRHRLKAIVFTKQSQLYTEFNTKPWPFLPEEGYKDTGDGSLHFINQIGLSVKSPLFDLNESEIEYDFLNSDTILGQNLVYVKLKLVDDRVNFSVDYESAIMPRN